MNLVNFFLTPLLLSPLGCLAMSMTPNISQQTPYCVNLKCIILPSRRMDFLNLISENQRLTLQNEPDALQYTVGEDVSEPNTFYIHEQFKSQQGFAAHRDTPHNEKWQIFRKSNPFAEGGEPKVDFYHGTHAPVVIPVRKDIYCLNVKLCIKSQSRDEFLDVIKNNARGSNEDEPLCLQYVWGEDENEENTFHFHEQYTGDDGGKEGFNAHTTTSHFASWEKFAAKDPFSKPPVVSFYRTLS